MYVYTCMCADVCACVWRPQFDTEFCETEFFLNPELINWTCHIGSLLWRMPVSHRVRLQVALHIYITLWKYWISSGSGRFRICHLPISLVLLSHLTNSPSPPFPHLFPPLNQATPVFPRSLSPAMLVGVGDPSSCSQACLASILAIQSFLQPPKDYVVILTYM